jgi:hypothetical protein
MPSTPKKIQKKGTGKVTTPSPKKSAKKETDFPWKRPENNDRLQFLMFQNMHAHNKDLVRGWANIFGVCRPSPAVRLYFHVLTISTRAGRNAEL